MSLHEQPERIRSTAERGGLEHLATIEKLDVSGGMPRENLLLKIGAVRVCCFDQPVRSFTVLAMVMALALVATGTLIGLVTLWPGQRSFEAPALAGRSNREPARVISVAETTCRVPGGTDCERVSVEITGGPLEASRGAFTVGDAADIRLDVGDQIYVYENRVPGGVVAGVKIDRFGFADFDRERPLLLLVALFVVAVVLTGRLQGARSLVGLAGSLVVIVGFVVPAILDGASPVGVALVGALAVMLITIPLSHGIGPKSLAAALGTAGSLVLTVLLARLFVDAAHLSGLSSDEAAVVGVVAEGVSVSGLLLAGMVIAALGVLDDVTVSQSSTVMALRATDPALGARQLFRRALGVGRDHVAATVNTLVLAYAGAALPLLLIFSLADTDARDAVTSEIVAQEVVATLVGSIGLILAVPITTALATLLAVRVPPGTDAAHLHPH